MMDVTCRAFVTATFGIGLLTTAVLAQHTGHGQDDLGHEQEHQRGAVTMPKCPVMGDPVNLAVSMETDEGPVYFCCDMCKPKFKGSPAKYADKVAAQRKTLADLPNVQVTCPVTGEPVDSKVTIQHKGKTLAFCCKDCISKYEADPAKYASALANSYTYQTKCPVSGEDIDPQSFAVTADGMHVYFCCDRCPDKFFDEPDKYVKNLEAQGYNVSAKKMVRGKDGKADPGHNSDGHEGHNH